MVNVLVDNLRRSLVVDDDWLRSVVNNGRWNDVHNLWLILLDDMRLMVVVRGINDDNVLAVAVVAVTFAVVAVTFAVTVAVVAGIDNTNVLLAFLAVADAVSVFVSVVSIDDDNVLAVAVAVAVAVTFAVTVATVAVTVAVIVAIVATIATVAVSMSVSVVGIDDNNLGLVVMMMMSLLA